MIGESNTVYISNCSIHLLGNNTFGNAVLFSKCVKLRMPHDYCDTLMNRTENNLTNK